MLLISDLHLEPEREDITLTLFDFLRTRAATCGELFVLGDLFELWVGDDAENPLADRVASELLALSRAGNTVYLMHGNRDFLLGEDYAQRCGARLLNEPHLLNWQGQRIALLHGDVLCTRDTGYMAFRKMVRDPAWQQEFLSKPTEARRVIAQQARQQSQRDTSEKTMEIMDVSQNEVVSLMQDLDVTTLIHGHTHRPSVHTMKIPVASTRPAGSANEKGKEVMVEARRIVLGDWDKQGWCVALDSQGIHLEHFPLLA